MDTYDLCVVPSEDDFLAAFGVSADERRPSDGFWAYTFEGEMGTTIRLSFDVFERSVQTAITTPAGTVATVSCERAIRVAIDEEAQTVIATLTPRRYSDSSTARFERDALFP